MRKIINITEEQWLSFARFVEEALDATPSPGTEPISLSYEAVKGALGFSGKVDFYLALWQCHQQRDPRPGFWFHGCHRPGHLPETLMIYRRVSST